MSKATNVQLILDNINQEMINLDIWQSTIPDKEALKSDAPFCCDTLSFSQWLEFVLLPKMTMLIDSNMPLPSEFEILPMAVESWKNEEKNMSMLLTLIEQLDAAFK